MVPTKGDFVPRETFGDLFGCHGWAGCCLDINSYRPGTLLNILQCTRQPPTTKNYLAPGLNRAKAKKAGVVNLLLQAAVGTVGTGIEVSTCCLEAAVPWEDALGKATRDHRRTLG